MILLYCPDFTLGKLDGNLEEKRELFKLLWVAAKIMTTCGVLDTTCKCSYMTTIHSFPPSSLMSNLYLYPLSRFNLQEVCKNSDVCIKQNQTKTKPNNLDTIFTIKLAKILTFLNM